MAAQIPITRRDSAEWRSTKRFYVKIIEGLADTQVGPIYIGVWGIIALVFFAVTVFMILFGYLQQVGFNPILFVREFAVLSVEPPAPSYGLRLAPLAEGGYWQIATFFLTLTLVFWAIRIWSRAIANGLRPTVPLVFTTALLLYAAIYIIHPLTSNSWNEAPGHGLRAGLVWANAFSIKYGNFYYNPFHMVSIFGLLGSTLLLAMHGATILATVHLNSHREIDEAENSTEGTHRAQLLWRWVMGFNATATSIHTWAAALAIVAMIAGALGVILTGVAEPNWFQWACRAGVVPGTIQAGASTVAACLP
jgi:photosynthetic reaction center M subunit